MKGQWNIATIIIGKIQMYVHVLDFSVTISIASAVYIMSLWPIYLITGNNPHVRKLANSRENVHEW